MGTNSKHTEGKLRAERSKVLRNYDIFLKDENDDSVCRVYLEMATDVQGKANAARIVKIWNNWDEATELLKEFVKMQNDPTYGDVVWRLAVKEKAEKLLNSIN
jgi:hypothetical protein